MKRDMDFIRDLLLEIEDGRSSFSTLSKATAIVLGIDPNDAISEEESKKLEYHLDLLREAGFAEFIALSGGIWQVDRVTWKGHEFLDNIRDPEVWRQTKVGASKAGGFSLKVIASVAEAIIKSRIEKLMLGNLDA